MAKAYCEQCLHPTRKKYFYEPYKIVADYLCYDCEIYLCSTCIFKHTDHLTFSAADKSNKTKLDQFGEGMMQQLTSEGDQILEKFTQERSHVCDVVDVINVSGNSASSRLMDICILRLSKKWAITDKKNNCIKVFNINNNQMTASANLKHEPSGMTEIPSTDPSKCLIAVSYSFPYEKQINILNIQSDLALVISSFNVLGECRDLSYCNNKLITLFWDYLDRLSGVAIHIMDMSGEIINIIDLNKLSDIKLKRHNNIRMSVHPESETLYLCYLREPSCVISLSIDGQVLHSVNFTKMDPRCVCVDIDQNVYVMDDSYMLYKLSSDLGQTENSIDDEFLYKCFQYIYNFPAIACHADTFYIARSDGRVVIIRHE